MSNCCLIICKLQIAARAFRQERPIINNYFHLMITIIIRYLISRTVCETLQCPNIEQDRLVKRGNLHQRGGGAPQQIGSHGPRERGGGAHQQRGGHGPRERGGGAPPQRG